MTKEEIQRVLDLSLEYYKSEVFGTNKESEKPSRERIDWIYDKMNGDSEVPKELKEAAVNIADELLVKPKDYALSAKADYWNGAYDGIIAGAKWQKEQMMKEAVEGYVWVDYGFDSIPSYLQINLGPIKGNDEVHDGDKVRVIVLPKED